MSECVEGTSKLGVIELMELPAPGQIFQRKYQLQEILGRGGFAAVYRATDIEIGRDVAIKVLAPSEDGYADGVAERFSREARVIGSFQDPHTITMFEFGTTDDGLLFMVFEYVRGDDLSDVIRTRGALSQSEVAHIMQQLLQSLREAHAAGVLHRDIKPANVLVYNYMGDPNRVKLLDFGIAKAVAGEDGKNLTREGAMIGTPRYMSPEQIYGGALSARSDLYSLGLVAYEMLVGRPAINGSTSKEMLRAQLTDAQVRLPRDRVAASEPFCQVIDRLTSRDPMHRFESAAEVTQALEWAEQQIAEPVAPQQQFSGGYTTPVESPRSEELMGQLGERVWEGAHPSSAMHVPHAPHAPHPGAMQPPPQHYRPGYGPPNPHYPQQHKSGPYMGQPLTPYPQDQPVPHDDVSLGKLAAAGVVAALLVVGLLMLMSFFTG